MPNRFPRSRKIVDELNACGITHFVYLVDRRTRPIFDIISSDGQMTMIPVCREGEAFAIAAGLITGGKKPVVFMQSTGFFESGDSIRYLVVHIKLPLLILIGARGWEKNKPVTDSAAVFIEPILKAWGIKCYLVDTVEDAENISIASREIEETSKAVAILITPESNVA